MAEYESRHWTCEEFEKALPDLFENAQGGKLSADPRFADILRDCPQAAELVRDCCWSQKVKCPVQICGQRLNAVLGKLRLKQKELYSILLRIAVAQYRDKQYLHNHDDAIYPMRKI